MEDMKAMVDAVRHLNQVWKASNLIKNRDSSIEAFNILCDVDETISCLIDKVGESVKILTINAILNK